MWRNLVKGREVFSFSWTLQARGMKHFKALRSGFSSNIANRKDSKVFLLLGKRSKNSLKNCLHCFFALYRDIMDQHKLCLSNVWSTMKHPPPINSEEPLSKHQETFLPYVCGRFNPFQWADSKIYWSDSPRRFLGMVSSSAFRVSVNLAARILILWCCASSSPWGEQCNEYTAAM